MLRFFSTLEKTIVLLLVLVMIFTGTYLYRRFIRDHSVLLPSQGGIFTEGVIGRPTVLNPALLSGSPVDRDISALIFSGLTRYNPSTGLIEDDLATSEKSKDNLTYTFTILSDALWHDGKPVTSDDVLFTYQTLLQSPLFPSPVLRQMFSDVSIEKVSPRVVTFRLKRPYSFFLANVTLGLLPSHLLKSIAPQDVSSSDFNQRPVGSGPYQFVNWSASNEIHEITLKRFDEYYGISPKIQTIIFRAFPDQKSLLLSENTLSGFRLQHGERPGDTGRFSLFSYSLPQYTALFLNTDSDILINKKTRLGLLLATNKQEILSQVSGAKLVESPILESQSMDDSSYDLTRSQGALFDAQWFYPNKLKEIEAKRKESEKKPEPSPPAVLSSDAYQYLLTALSDSWMTIAVDGMERNSFLLKKGEQKKLIAKKSLLFSTIGNAGGIEVSVNSVILKPFGRLGEVVKNVLLDVESLPKYLTAPLKASQPAALPAPSVPEPSPEASPAPSLSSDELDKIRVNLNGKRLILRLITAQEPPIYLKIAEAVQRQWLEVGAKIVIETYPLDDLQEKIASRDYDILLFGQNLGYNLDAFPFWHSSQAGSGLNLSNYRSLEADNLLVDIRKTFDERTKQDILLKLRKTIALDSPAIFLFNPPQSYSVDSSFKNVKLQHLSNHSDRLLDLLSWYQKEQYQLKSDITFRQIVRWIFTF